MTSQKFGSLVYKRRKKLGLSQQKLGLMLGRKQSPTAAQKLISNIETGIGVANRQIIIGVCKILKINLVPKTIERVPITPFDTNGLFTPDAAKEDIELVASNAWLQRHLDTKFSEIMKTECQKYRKAIESLE